MFTKASEFSAKGSGSEPFAYSYEGVSIEDIQRAGGAKAYVRAYVKQMIAVQNYSKSSDATVYKMWRAGWEFDQWVRDLKAFMNEQLAEV